MSHTVTMQQPKRAAALNIRTITMTALLSAMAYVLAFVEFPVPLSPSFARMDLSDFPALIGAFAFGPISGLLIELVKNTLQLLTTSTGGIGEIANFLMGASYVVAAGVLYKHRKTKKTALLACVAASFVMGAAAAQEAAVHDGRPVGDHVHGLRNRNNLIAHSVTLLVQIRVGCSRYSWEEGRSAALPPA